MRSSIRADVAIAGGGIIGLSLGLELQQRGLSVVVMERQRAMSSASWAAGGMLAALDPQNPPELMPLSLRSIELYPGYLERLQELSGKAVPVRTNRAMQYVGEQEQVSNPVTATEVEEYAPGLKMNGYRFEWLQEDSIDPNDVREALPPAFRVAGGTLLEETDVLHVESVSGGVFVRTTRDPIAAKMFVNCCGSWAGDGSRGLEALPVSPVRGQMANLRCQPERLRCVVRAPGIYLIPRGDGRVTIGSTIEHAGYDENVQEEAIQKLAQAALALLPEADSSRMDMWAGLRPGTPDMLPILGRSKVENCWHATGHYRDGILLTPVTARVMAQAMLGQVPDVALDAFAPARFMQEETPQPIAL